MFTVIFIRNMSNPCDQDPFCKTEVFIVISWVIFALAHVFGLGGLVHLWTKPSQEVPKSLEEGLLEHEVKTEITA